MKIQSEKLKVIKENVEYEFEAAEEGGYASAPDYPSCVSQGETLDEALANIKDALIGCLLAARDLNFTHSASGPGYLLEQ